MGINLLSREGLHDYGGMQAQSLTLGSCLIFVGSATDDKRLKMFAMMDVDNSNALGICCRLHFIQTIQQGKKLLPLYALPTQVSRNIIQVRKLFTEPVLQGTTAHCPGGERQDNRQWLCSILLGLLG